MVRAPPPAAICPAPRIKPHKQSSVMAFLKGLLPSSNGGSHDKKRSGCGSDSD
jgi:hypothetical protein